MFTDNTYPKKLKESLYQKAVTRTEKTHGTRTIHPVATRKVFDNCFTEDEGYLLFWYDIQIDCGRTTALIKELLPN